MKTIKGPGIFLAQFISEESPFNTLDSILKWVADIGYTSVQLPTWNIDIFDVKLAASSKEYASEILGKIRENGLILTEICSHLHGNMIASHPAYDSALDLLCPKKIIGKPKERSKWATEILKSCAIASKNMNLKNHVTFPGCLLWPYLYPGMLRPKGIIEEGYREHSKKWIPLLNFFDEHGINICYEVHGAQDIHDGITFEKFLKAVNNHKRCKILFDPSHFVLQGLDYLSYIDHYHEFIKVFHVKDAEFNPSGKQGMYSGYENWIDRAATFRSLGDGQVKFKNIFSKFTKYNYEGWATLEWECCMKNKIDGAIEGFNFISKNIINMADSVFESEAGKITHTEKNLSDLGIK